MDIAIIILGILGTMLLIAILIVLVMNYCILKNIQKQNDFK